MTNQQMKMAQGFYIIETSYVGPNSDQNIDADKIEISTSPATANLNGEVKTEGWCGTTNDWAVYAHGEYETIDEARAAIKSQFGNVRECDEDNCYDGVVESYRTGKYIPMNTEQTGRWADEGLNDDLDAETTDERITELVAEYEKIANADGYTLSSSLEDMIIERRQELRDEKEDYES